MLEKQLCNVLFQNIIKRNLSKNHYDILKLKKDCTKNDIKQAFLKLSKEYHPDKNNSKDSHSKYVEILEAYKVLSRPYTRRLHDIELTEPNFNHRHPIYNNDPTRSSPFWEHRDKSEDKYYEDKPYYGIKKIKQKIPNSWIVLFCCAVATFGITVQILAVRHSYTLRREEMKKKSDELVILHSKIREQALRNGNSLQLELLKRNLGYQDEDIDEIDDQDR